MQFLSIVNSFVRNKSLLNYLPLTGTNVPWKIKNIIRTFCSCKPLKRAFSLNKILMILIKKA